MSIRKKNIESLWDEPLCPLWDGLADWESQGCCRIGDTGQAKPFWSGFGVLHLAACLVLKDVSIALIKQLLGTLLGTGELLCVMSN